jgi:SAM-dependent methyltransferase
MANDPGPHHPDSSHHDPGHHDLGTAAGDPGLYARSFADVYDAWYGDLDDPAHVVAALLDRCRPGGRVIEFGGGTGRLAEPIAAAGFAVISLDVSATMLRSGAANVHRLVADMAAPALRARCADAIVIAYNTLFNLASIELQRRCLTRAAQLLSHGGLLAIEGFIAPPVEPHAPTSFGASSRPHPTDPDATLTIITEIRHRPGGATIIGTHVEHSGPVTTCRPWRLAYQSPAQLDDTALAASLELADRRGDWQGGSFDGTGERHVSWYRRREA